MENTMNRVFSGTLEEVVEKIAQDVENTINAAKEKEEAKNSLEDLYRGLNKFSENQSKAMKQKEEGKKECKCPACMYKLSTKSEDELSEDDKKKLDSFEGNMMKLAKDLTDKMFNEAGIPIPKMNEMTESKEVKEEKIFTFSEVCQFLQEGEVAQSVNLPAINIVRKEDGSLFDTEESFVSFTPYYTESTYVIAKAEKIANWTDSHMYAAFDAFARGNQVRVEVQEGHPGIIGLNEELSITLDDFVKAHKYEILA